LTDPNHPTPQPLRPLFASIPVDTGGQELPDTLVNGIAFDSRAVQPGNLFIALGGISSDGHRFIPDAVRRGAAAVVGSKPADDLGEVGVPYVQVADTRRALAYLSAAFYGFPGRSLTVIGVTGTDGKTTTSNLIYQILLAAGLRAGMVSTVNAVIGDTVLDTGFHVTTPEAPDVQRYLAQMVAAGLTHAVLEATSHGLAQDRVTGAAFDAAVVTNITHEHLDYHGTYEAYRAAKGRLFEFVKETQFEDQGTLGVAVLNRDDSSYDYLAGLSAGLRQVSYSQTAGQADLWAEDVRFGPGGMDFTIVTREQRLPVHCSVPGRFNVSNCLAAAGLAWLGMGLPAEAIQQGIAGLRGVPGRMEIIDLGQPFLAIVDFAHTPNALQQALTTAREMTQGRVIAVFGSAGLRDREKRRMMAETSAERADISIFTAEDPRTESLDEILAIMARAAVSRGGVEGQTFLRVPDRGEAIRAALRLARPGDLVIACGKGHEQSMCFGSQEYHWDDRTAMRAALAELLGLDGPRMPYLPTQA
jgi:UDP-N-acetylmuramoyl-L-alanyl-D-glutamate--2,6-diaminopimelate ligase